MRLWHKDLLKALPRQQLLAQWRELCSIYAKQDNHMLINFVYDDISSLKAYSDMVIDEFKARGYKIGEAAMNKYKTYFQDKEISEVEQIFPHKMNCRYFNQCYYNLEEKYDCGGITEEEFKKIKAVKESEGK